MIESFLPWIVGVAVAALVILPRIPWGRVRDWISDAWESAAEDTPDEPPVVVLGDDYEAIHDYECFIAFLVDNGETEAAKAIHPQAWNALGRAMIPEAIPDLDDSRD